MTLMTREAVHVCRVAPMPLTWPRVFWWLRENSQALCGTVSYRYHLMLIGAPPVLTFLRRTGDKFRVVQQVQVLHTDNPFPRNPSSAGPA